MGKTVKIVVHPGQKPTDEQRERLRKAAQEPIAPDDDAPEYTMAELEQMRLAAVKRRAEQKKEVVAIRLSPSTLKKAKAVGKGYTGFLSRLIDNAINDKDLVARSL